MATTPNTLRPDPRTIVTSSTRLWSDEVALVNASEDVAPHDPAYEFSNGTKKVEKTHYEQPLSPTP